MTEWQIVLLAAGVLLAANFLAILLFVLFAKLPAGRFKETIQGVIFELDRFADSMSNPEKRRSAVQQINDVLGWRRILVPAALIGWVIDMEVSAIRKMQAATNTSDLHVEEENENAKSNAETTKTTDFTGQE